MQRVIGEIAGKYEFLDLPDPEAIVLDGVKWGAFEQPLTPAFWVSQAWMDSVNRADDFRLGKSLLEEVIICLLGGHGMPAEVGLAASRRLLERLQSEAGAVLSERQIEELLREPLAVNGRRVRYRFAMQRSKYLSASMRKLPSINEHELSDIEFRDALRQLPGIGPKTASWIVRNRRGSDDVAILDVHIVRACQIMSVFEDNANPARKYTELERRFLEFCSALGVRASVLDAVMWATMRKISKPLLRMLDGSLSHGESTLPLFQERIA
jgi:thermostable 8-oxoguanine DNA glycosylase